MQTKEVSYYRTLYEKAMELYYSGVISKDELDKIKSRIMKPAINNLKKYKDTI
jgi:hypothetical protein